MILENNFSLLSPAVRKSANILTMGSNFLINLYIVVGGCVIIIAHGKVYERCALARELRDVHEIPHNQLSTWMCIVRHESEYNTSAINPGSGDHGLLQISELFWCSPPGYACGVSCADLRDDDIEDDVICARRVFREHKRLSGDGFNAWAVYGLYCRDKQYADTFLKDCFAPGALRASEDVPEKPLPTVDYYPRFNKKTTTVPTATTNAASTAIETVQTTKATTKPITEESTTFRKSIHKSITPTSVGKITKVLATTSKYTTLERKQLTPKQLTTTSATIAVSEKIPKPIANAEKNNQGKLLHPTEENDEFSYAITKTGYKFTRF